MKQKGQSKYRAQAQIDLSEINSTKPTKKKKIKFYIVYIVTFRCGTFSLKKIVLVGETPNRSLQQNVVGG